MVYTYGDDSALNNRVGRIERTEDGAGIQEFSYDVLGKVMHEHRVIAIPYVRDDIAFDLYDDGSRLQGHTYPDEEVVSYIYEIGIEDPVK